MYGMYGMYWLGAAVTLFLLVYLVIALFHAEEF